MNDPDRLVEDGASDFERQLLRAWHQERPSERAHHAALAVAGISTASKSTAAMKAIAGSASPKATLALGVAKWLGIGFLMGVVTSVAALHYAASPTHPAPRMRWEKPATRRPASGQVEAPTTAVVAADASVRPPTGPTHSIRTPASTPRRPVASTEGSLGPEMAAIDGARTALRSKQPEQALERLAEYQQRFPNGVLAQEAQVLRIEALMQQGKRSDARRQACQFLNAHPDSPHAERLEELGVCTTNP